MALTRVQSTGRVTAAPIGGTSMTLTFSTPPLVGNAVVVLVTVVRGAAGMALPFPGCTDNHGNVYSQAVGIVEAIGLGTAAVIYYCPALTTTGTPFTVTFDVGLGVTNFTACALEISGGAPALVLHQTSSHQGLSSAAPSTGATTALTVGDGLVVAVCALTAGVASLTVGAATPTWTEEYEALTGACGEGDSRLITGALGTTQSATWTPASASNYAAVLAVFAPTAAGPLLAAFANRTAGLDQAFTIDQDAAGTTDLYSPGRLAIGTDDRVAITAPDDLYVNAEGVLTGLSGDVTAAGPMTALATIAAHAVSFAKFVAATAAKRLIGRGAGTAGDFQELTLGPTLDLTGTRLDVIAVPVHAPTHSAGGTDPVTVTNLAGYPGGTTTFLRADATFATPPASGLTQLTGDVLAGPGSGSQAATIANDAVTYAKLQNVSAASRLLGRGSASGAGDAQELTLGSGLTLTGTVLAASAGSPHYDCPLSDGDLVAADLIFAAGECVIVQVPV